MLMSLFPQIIFADGDTASLFCSRSKDRAIVRCTVQNMMQQDMSVEILGSENRIKPNTFCGKFDRVIYLHYHPQKTA